MSLNIPQLLRTHGLRPDKRLGQNFLVDDSHLERIVEAAGVQPGDEVLEVGPGLGSLTRHLSAAAQRVVTVELDADLLPVLRSVLADHANVEIVHGDILKVDLRQHFSQPGFLVIANIPYYLTSNLIRHLLEGAPRPARLALTVQKEVAQRACAGPPDMSLLSLSVQLYGQPKLVHHIPAGAFYPAPKVDSALLLIDLYDQPALPAEQVSALFTVAKAAFAQKRKTLANSLAAMPGLDKPRAAASLQAAGIDPLRRPQTLSLAEWGALLEAVS
ncbi:MAG: ribosomal RNA small subunit methyltransferase A [Anaerolineales bacterium]|nr:ribosomal RNA small subunit methyltransferase A [Anaerolineales bacterium]MCW5856576.1 ribosomal RNA small subunit methyltransferase A [Anaerolineales bacterium]